ncbi:FecR domain-containing protein [Porifericola rhodea]|uniref:FecR family protein n=1 Tax=Porifericola rhodea TaxID=930972 RepID=UPI0026655290|nr:FecR domain-containing protein [Porifericola rhodea]WKN30360.1 FecR domain-containing protein [Porifericola rhodea]
MDKEQYENYQSYQLNDFILDESFQQWAQGYASPFWDHFVEAFPEKENAIKEAKLLVSVLSVPETPLSWQKKEQQLNAIYSKVEARQKKGKTIKMPTRWAYAAAVSALLVLSVSVYYFFYIMPFQYYETAYQQNETFVLDDGTEVVLNANSELKVSRDLETKEVREVWLEGEAYFKVTKIKQEGESSSFVVHTPNLDVQVLGTHFNVRSRDGNTRVLLEEGSVKIASVETNEDILMIPGEAVEFNVEEGQIRKEIVSEPKELAWQQNFFVFENQTLGKVAEEIYQYYGIELVFEDEAMRDYIFTAEVSRDNLQLLKTLMEEAFQIDIEPDGHQLIIKRK